jgi:RNA recognition motif-containing protein
MMINESLFNNNKNRYGEIIHVELVRDQKTGKPKGFAFIQYEDQRSTILAVDNLGGANVRNKTQAYKTWTLNNAKY